MKKQKNSSLEKYVVTVNSKFKHEVVVEAESLGEAKSEAERLVADDHDDYSRWVFVEIKAGDIRYCKAKEVIHEE